MIELDYLVIGDYVRADGGLMHIMAAGIDTITAPVVPTAAPLGIAARLLFGTAEVPGTPHTITLTFTMADTVLATVIGPFTTPERDPTLPIHWPTKLQLALRATVALPVYGDYALEVALDDKSIKSLDFRVLRPAQG